MSKREKLIQRFLSKPADFSWGELKSLLEGFGYSLGTAAEPVVRGLSFFMRSTLRLSYTNLIRHRF